MRLHRFYVQQPLGEEVVIDNVSLIKQWLKVFRYREEDTVILFNGDGYENTYSLKEIEQKKCTLTLVSRASSFLPTSNLNLYFSITKKDTFELVVQKATELGVSTITPIISSRSEKKNINFERLHTIATEASEQCMRGDVPIIRPITKLDDTLLSELKRENSYLLHMTGKPVSSLSRDKKTSASIFIGPEGGWSPDEEELFKKNNIEELSLGKTVLRAETAAIAAMTLFLY